MKKLEQVEGSHVNTFEQVQGAAVEARTGAKARVVNKSNQIRWRRGTKYRF